MSKRIRNLAFLFLFILGISSCSQQQINTAQLQGNWDAVSADVTDSREDHEIIDETRISMVETDTTMMLSFQDQNATLSVNMQHMPDADTTLQYSGTWEFIDSPQDSLIIPTGDVDWKFAVNSFSENSMELTFVMPMMSENQLHTVVFEKK